MMKKMPQYQKELNKVWSRNVARLFGPTVLTLRTFSVRLGKPSTHLVYSIV